MSLISEIKDLLAERDQLKKRVEELETSLANANSDIPWPEYAIRVPQEIFASWAVASSIKTRQGIECIRMDLLAHGHGLTTSTDGRILHRRHFEYLGPSCVNTIYVPHWVAKCVSKWKCDLIAVEIGERSVAFCRGEGSTGEPDGLPLIFAHETPDRAIDYEAVIGTYDKSSHATTPPVDAWRLRQALEALTMGKDKDDYVPVRIDLPKDDSGPIILRTVGGSWFELVMVMPLDVGGSK